MRREFSPIFLCLKLPRRIRGPSIELKRLNITDGPFLKKVVSAGAVKHNGSSPTCMKTNSFGLWWWARKKYVCVYTIRKGERRIGLTGLYNFDPRRSVEMTLIIASQGDRGRGYGSEAFHLFLRCVSRTDAVKRILVTIDPSDRETFHFWERMGFREATQSGDHIVLIREISPLPPHDEKGDFGVLLHDAEGNAAH